MNEKIIEIDNRQVVARSSRRFWLREESECGCVGKGVRSDRDGTVLCLNCISVSILVVRLDLSSTRSHRRRNWAESTGDV